MRGLKYVQIPTTLLAMVDSAVGGKTAIDHPRGKNLLGAFHQPRFVFVDAAWLLTLPAREFSNGMAEVVKTAAIWDAADFAKLEDESDAIHAAVLSDEARAAPVGQGHTLATRTTSQTLLLDVIRGSIGVKAHIVTIDEKETGLRNLVNFGHSIGHAIEAVLTPAMLHGECIAVGMVLEAELSRLLHGLPQVAIARLVRCLRNYELPVSLSDARIAALPAAHELTAARLLDIMRVDKKNAGVVKKVVLLSRIGATVEERASTVSDDDIARVLAPSVLVRDALPAPVACATLATPGSKSVSNRALVLAALSGSTCRLRNLLHSDDTQVMMSALRALRAANFAWEDGGATLVVQGQGGRLVPPAHEIYLQNAGTAARFVTGVCTLLREGDVMVTGNARMKQRPIGPLVDALRENGVDVQYRGTDGCLPLAVRGGGLQGGRIALAADVSSQYVSAVLLCAPYAAREVTLELVGGKVISQPYIDMTIAMMREFGVAVERLAHADGTPRDAYRVPRTTYVAPAVYEVESDASSATYPLALAAITGTQVTVPTIGSASLQGDARFAVDVLRPMGCHVEQTATSTTVVGPPPGLLRQLGAVDMEPMTDAFITAAMLCAVATPGASTRITGVANQRVKECNRLRAVVDELAKLGVLVREHEDGVEVFGVSLTSLRAGAHIHCYDDHRIAMAFSVLAAVTPGAGTTLDRRCVEKTWPSFWDVLARDLRVPVAAADVDAPVVPLPAAPRALAPVPGTYAPHATVLCIGMRASGKTHVGRRLAAHLGRTFVDADDVFQARHDLSVFVATHGWDRFREEETRILRELLELHATDAVIALGGGAVEHSVNRALLCEYAARHGPVVHVVRELAAIESFLATSDRPAYGEPVADVYARRLPWYTACACVETANDGDAAETVTALARQLRVCFAPPALREPSFFLSLTFPDVRAALDRLPEASAGVDALELRVDLLSADGIPSAAAVCAQLVALRAASALPILFTVRSASQGGRFPDADHDRYFALVNLGLRLGCELVDVELNRPAARLAAVRDARGHALLVASAHDLSGALPWQSAALRRLYERGRTIGQVVKLVGMARSVDDNLALERFRADVARTAPHPLIALNMQPAGQLSRVLNTLLTPVTHPALPARAAPGQLSVAQVHAARHLLGMLPARRFALLGTPIAHSLSPLIHNTGFALLGLPHTYERLETDDIYAVQAFVRAPDFGGASVTIPLKLRAMQLLDEVAPDAQVIGAVNTIVPRAREDGTVALVGENTDWRAIEALARRHLHDAPHTALVIGAGGSARAALYAMHKLGASRILLFNRTRERALELATAVPIEWRVDVVASLEDAAAAAPNVVVSNVPADGTALTATTGAGIVLPHTLLHHATGVAIDMAYRPAHTPLLQLVAERDGWHGVAGLDILLEQAFHQFRLWTHLPPPEAVISERAWAAYNA